MDDARWLKTLQAQHDRYGIKAIADLEDRDLADLAKLAEDVGDLDLAESCDIQIECNDAWRREQEVGE